ncbi:hypothetical protein A2767_04760 [Candidatus Roizmanbacteria bacterium RIFCSPHIGHO2_01_FULL_35_10]|uniref:NYN domain-containing protein n=1 Tax=Candidatus Roizmanbacteria bacterium RIFCSPLOWO2_01_FULL_35_13 TaxID=1802055 RepID=A0A1F7IAA1_9BACT|nr:MAG: hypothetical protein A2767_04760 [Candidatus Roizmanbacteria bacterium RIFCSPHIGHO2_01_FULL_35_10]OGK40279.1 MAG: hypothetical protein A3A74_07275 [Candidatus Roizmanbacteria bacterium RIFCSPLOWO2_01_FULL_35_13]
MKTYCFIDAANLFYGGEKSLGWKIDYKKLIKYIKEKYKVKKVFYYAGVELHGFSYSVLDKKPLDLKKLLLFLNKKKISELKTIKRVKFYLKLGSFEYILKLKPVKIFHDGKQIVKKANCDVDMTFDLMRYIKQYSSVLILSGDGDFVVVLKYLKDINKKITILARGERTAKELKQLVGSDFRDFSRLKSYLEFIKK